MDISKVRAIVYDLDGTVYDDNRHFALYAREIQAHLDPEVHADFLRDYEAVAGGRHPALRVGSFYDVERDLILLPRGGRVVRALHWEGAEVPPVVRQQLYPGTVEPDNRNIINVGDLWWVPSAISLHYGGNPENHSQCFLRIRDIMASADYAVSPIPGLASLIGSLKGRVVQVLATNSPQPDSEAILSKVGLLGLFDRMYFSSRKPQGLTQIFQEISDSYGIPMAAILSVGDNLVNEIAPARAMGCQTAFIDPHGLGSDEDADLRAGSMLELMPLLARAGA